MNTESVSAFTTRSIGEDEPSRGHCSNYGTHYTNRGILEDQMQVDCLRLIGLWIFTIVIRKAAVFLYGQHLTTGERRNHVGSR